MTKLRTLTLAAAAATALASTAAAERGTDGELKMLYWQAPSILNPYLSGGTKDIHAASLVLEPLVYASTANDWCRTQDVEEANRLLDEAGWARGSDGVRAKDGVTLSILYQTSTNSVRQGTQATRNTTRCRRSLPRRPGSSSARRSPSG